MATESPIESHSISNTISLTVAYSCSYEAKGMIARVDMNECYPSVQQTEYSFEEAFSKFGISDGDALLSSDEHSPYIQSILADATKVKTFYMGYITCQRS
jgi:hypothetical protein